ncbi:MAG: hypothetical protein ABR562_01385 [Thermoplasmatota archaeon]|nr:hypothetical protein [Halobacteriales archaeon]
MRGVLVCVVVAVALAGCTDFSGYKPSNQLGLVRIDVAAPVVSTGQVQLDVIATLDNLAAPSGELNLTVKAFDVTTNMLIATAHADVGAMEKDRSKEVKVRLALPRISGYRIEVAVGQAGRIVQRGQVQVSNVVALEPTVYDTGLRIGDVDVQVIEAKDAKVRVKASTYLTNEGGHDSRPLRLQLRAREVSTGVLADEKWVDLAAVPADATRIAATELLLPDDFNYELLAAIWDGDVVVERGQGKVQFLPTYSQNATDHLVVTNPDISHFISGTGGAPTGGNRAGAGAATPGPGVAAVMAALAVSLFLLRRTWT